MKKLSFIILAALLMGCQTAPVVVECPCAIPVVVECPCLVPADATVRVSPVLDGYEGMRELARKAAAETNQKLEGRK
jgi:hypothetical protein